MLTRTSQPHHAQGKSFVVCPPLLKSDLPLGWLEPVPGGSEPCPGELGYCVPSELSYWKERGNEGKQGVRTPGRLEMVPGHPCVPVGHWVRVPLLRLPWELCGCSSSCTVRL